MPPLKGTKPTAMPGSECEEGWSPVTHLAKKKRGLGKRLLQLYGNDKYDRRMRVVPGYIDDDGTPIAMDESGGFPFNAVLCKDLSPPPKSPQKPLVRGRVCQAAQVSERRPVVPS